VISVPARAREILQFFGGAEQFLWVGRVRAILNSRAERVRPVERAAPDRNASASVWQRSLPARLCSADDAESQIRPSQPSNLFR